jgi:hypothetical protein
MDEDAERFWLAGEGTHACKQDCVAHGSTPVVRLDAHGTYEFSAFSPLKGCWPTCADDVVGLFWSLARAHLPRCLWWGGLNFSALLFDTEGELQVPMTMREEADLIAYAQVRSFVVPVCQTCRNQKRSDMSQP